MELLLLFVTESHGNSDVPNTDTREQILFLLAKSRGNPDVLTGGAEELDQEENHGGKVEEEKAAVEVVRQLPPLPPFVRCYKFPPSRPLSLLLLPHRRQRFCCCCCYSCCLLLQQVELLKRRSKAQAMFDRCAFEKLVYDISKKVKSDVTVLVALGSVKQINLSGCPLTGALKVSDQWYSIDSNMAGITALCGVLGKLHEVLGENLPLVMADSRNSPGVFAALTGSQQQREEAAAEGAATATENDSKRQTQRLSLFQSRCLREYLGCPGSPTVSVLARWHSVIPATSICLLAVERFSAGSESEHAEARQHVYCQIVRLLRLALTILPGAHTLRSYTL